MKQQRSEPPWATGCLVIIGGAGVGYGAQWVSGEARRSCAVILREHPSLFDGWTWEPLLTVVFGMFLGLVAWGIPAGVVRRRSRGVRVVVPGVVFGVAMVALVLVHFAWLGTPANVASDRPGVCTEEHVPPWWPELLPT
ncbi:hypothetical protein [Streptomyces sp. NPDC020965]|uniref:hypothetical protein n=1 Tax=Streptomyces sp. NPDC020965 TaxID=3365105 RepID=UPI00378D59EF